jgi:hypothetical protein
VTPRLWLVSALVVLAAGCGASDEGPAKKVAGDYARAFAGGDFARACALTTAPGPKCEEALRSLHDGTDINSEVKSVTVDGDRATATFEGKSFPVPLEKRGGEWRVAIRGS